MRRKWILFLIPILMMGCKELSLKKAKMPQEADVGSFAIKERPSPTRQAAQAYFEKGLRYYTEGELDKAISCFAEALKVDPEHKKAQKMFVESLKKRSEQKEEELPKEELSKEEELPKKELPKEELPKEEVTVVKEIPTSQEVERPKEEAPKEKLPPPEVERPKEKVEEISKEERRRFELIKDFKRKGMWDEAIKEIKLFLDDFPKTPLEDELIYLRAEVYFDKGDYNSAEKDYNEIVDLYKESPLIYDAKLRIADTYFKRGNYDEAISRYMRLEKELREFAMESPSIEEKGKGIFPSPTKKSKLAAMAQLGIAESYRNKRDYINALIEYYDVVRVYADPEARAQALYYIGYIYDFGVEVRDFRRAIAAYERVINDHPKSIWAPHARERRAYIKKHYL